MIKNINPQNISLTPIVTTKPWNLHNVDNSDLILVDTGSIDDVSIALEYVDYINYSGTGPFPINSDCSIALEQQSSALVNFQVGQSGSGHFNVNVEPKNGDGTYTRMIYSQIQNTFYNSTNNPVNIFGLDNIDFGLSRTNRHVTDNFLLLNIPRIIFGDKILASSVTLGNLPLDDNISIYDDGYGNMMAGNSIFYKIQEVGDFKNVINY